ncbi:hypothetical protein C1H76_2687 [Elsinoe australis]|uniref:Uncharacterized protein n=1 Tax=Elsinoe australis TaxID=40998 RepID=A0A4U7B693_9PEZI|nr:hypothetical protein C1H76_2687 [Elsinoe australis]
MARLRRRTLYEQLQDASEHDAWLTRCLDGLQGDEQTDACLSLLADAASSSKEDPSKVALYEYIFDRNALYRTLKASKKLPQDFASIVQPGPSSHRSASRLKTIQSQPTWENFPRNIPDAILPHQASSSSSYGEQILSCFKTVAETHSTDKANEALVAFLKQEGKPRLTYSLLKKFASSIKPDKKDKHRAPTGTPESHERDGNQGDQTTPDEMQPHVSIETDRLAAQEEQDPLDSTQEPATADASTTQSDLHAGTSYSPGADTHADDDVHAHRQPPARQLSHTSHNHVGINSSGNAAPEAGSPPPEPARLADLGQGGRADVEVEVDLQATGPTDTMRVSPSPRRSREVVDPSAPTASLDRVTLAAWEAFKASYTAKHQDQPFPNRGLSQGHPGPQGRKRFVPEHPKTRAQPSPKKHRSAWALPTSDLEREMMDNVWRNSPTHPRASTSAPELHTRVGPRSDAYFSPDRSAFIHRSRTLDPALDRRSIAASVEIGRGRASSRPPSEGSHDTSLLSAFAFTQSEIDYTNTSPAFQASCRTSNSSLSRRVQSIYEDFDALCRDIARSFHTVSHQVATTKLDEARDQDKKLVEEKHLAEIEAKIKRATSMCALATEDGGLDMDSDFVQINVKMKEKVKALQQEKMDAEERHAALISQLQRRPEARSQALAKLNELSHVLEQSLEAAERINWRTDSLQKQCDDMREEIAREEENDTHRERVIAR